MDNVSHVGDTDRILYKKCQNLLEDPGLQFLSDVKISINNKCSRYNKILFYLQYPFLAGSLNDCDLIIFADEIFKASHDNNEEETHDVSVCDNESAATVNDIDRDIFIIGSHNNLSNVREAFIKKKR